MKIKDKIAIAEVIVAVLVPIIAIAFGLMISIAII
tara:strand:+ start:1489 stop:1593 length:105 start_codon:yes stop_codon:yes gene_type:complete